MPRLGSQEAGGRGNDLQQRWHVSRKPRTPLGLLAPRAWAGQPAGLRACGGVAVGGLLGGVQRTAPESL